MLGSLSSALRAALVLSIGVGFIAAQGHRSAAYAKGDKDEGEEEDDTSDTGNDSSEDSEDGDDDKEQPPITAGGLYTLKTYPVRELFRPLTMTQNIGQMRLGIGTDVSNKGAFESVGVNLEALYGYTDNFMLLGGLTSAYNFKQFGLYAGFEGALYYDVIDFKLAAEISRPAVPATTGDPPMVDPGKYDGGPAKASIDIGFPLRYVAKPEIAIIALQNVISIDLDGSKPDLNPSLGIATNPIAALSLVIFATLKVANFDFTNQLTVPATARIEFSPNQKLDIGGEFVFLNVKPPEGQKFYDNRFLTLFIAARFGK
jgi:hypothetical protein